MKGKKISNVASTILDAGMAVCMMNGTPIVSISSDYGSVPIYYYDQVNLGISNLSYNYINSNVYSHSSYSKIEKEAQELFGAMRDASQEVIKGVSEYFTKISKDTGVDFWSLC